LDLNRRYNTLKNGRIEQKVPIWARSTLKNAKKKGWIGKSTLKKGQRGKICKNKGENQFLTKY
jgi:hypothetical protein